MKRNWAQLLQLIYTHEDRWEQFGKGDPPRIDEKHPFVTDTGMTVPEARAAEAFLKKNDLIELHENTYVITQKEFEVARDQELRQDQLQVNRSIVFLTFILALTSILSIVINLYQIELLGQIIMGVLLISLLGAVTYYNLFRMDLTDRQ